MGRVILMIDIHNHILPGIDDGSENIEQSLDMASHAVNEGISAIIATPHYIHETFEIANRQRIETEVESLNGILHKEGIDLRIYTGNEVFVSPGLSELVDKGIVGTLNNSRYILVEFPMGSIPLYTENVLYELQLIGLTPIIAHPERKSEINKDIGILQPFIDRGILLQINSGSLTGKYGSAVEKTAWKLLDSNMAHLVATDAHNNRSRNPMMKKAYQLVEKRIGSTAAEALFNNNPKHVLYDEDIENIEHVGKYYFIKKILNSFKK